MAAALPFLGGHFQSVPTGGNRSSLKPLVCRIAFQFNIDMKKLDEVICQDGVRYHQDIYQPLVSSAGFLRPCLSARGSNLNVDGYSGCSDSSCLVLSGIVLPSSGLIASQHTRMNFTQIYCTNFTLSWTTTPISESLKSWTLTYRLLQNAVHVAVLGHYLEATGCSECSNVSNYRSVQCTHITLQQCDLHWLSVNFSQILFTLFMY